MYNSQLRMFGVTATLLLSACGGTNNLDWDLRNNAGSTHDAAAQVTGDRPAADANGVISYPSYQVAVARKDDTVASLAARVGLAPDALARFNALKATDPLRAGEVLALPTRVATSAAPVAGSVIGAPSTGVDVATIATTALDRVDATGAPLATPQVPFSSQGSGPAPVRYQVKRGETAFTIARQFNISAKSLADWNGLGPDLSVREGQFLIIPTAADASRLPTAPDATPPGQGSPTPLPPSASQPLPTEKTLTVAEVAKQVPPSPDLSAQRTASSASKFAMPLDGKIIRSYQKGTNDGIDIAAAAGTPVRAATDGTVAVVTHDPSGAPILILRHDGGLLTVYVGIDGVTVAKDAVVKRGQTIAVVRAGATPALHFEVRQGSDSLDPLPYLQ